MNSCLSVVIEMELYLLGLTPLQLLYFEQWVIIFSWKLSCYLLDFFE